MRPVGDPIPRTTPRVKTKKNIRRVSKKRGIERGRYSKDRKKYLEDHPYCQAFIAQYGYDEATVIRNGGHAECGHIVPPATEIHHRNKTNGRRLLDQRWWMAISYYMHRWIEANKETARRIGFLLPIQANPDGEYAGKRGMETKELLNYCRGAI